MSGLVYIGLGSNVGNREAQLFAAVDALRRMDAVLVNRCSSLFESDPVGPPQERFLNAVVEVECSVKPLRLLGLLKQVEKDLGRQPRERWGPREIDLDILLWEGLVVAEPFLQVPHLELHKRRFALEPLCELAPNARHPITGEAMCQLLARLPQQGVVRYGRMQPLLLCGSE